MTDRAVVIEANASRPDGAVSPTLFGLFYEDLNRGCDGGSNANVIANHSFDEVYLGMRTHNEFIAVTTDLVLPTRTSKWHEFTVEEKTRRA